MRIAHRPVPLADGRRRVLRDTISNLEVSEQLCLIEF